MSSGLARFSMVGDHCTQILVGREWGVLRGGKLRENVCLVVLLDFESDVVIFIAVATF